MKVRGVDSFVAVAIAVFLLPGGMRAQMDPNTNPNAVPAAQFPGPQMQGQSGAVERSPGMTPNSNSRGTDQQPASMRDSLGAPGQNGQQILDKQFVRAAAQSSLADVKIGALANEKGSADIKDLAQKMVQDHTQMNQDLGSVADQLGVLLPKKLNRDDQGEYDKLNGLSGKDFDTEYISYLARSHWREVHNFRMEASVAVYPDLQSEVIKALGMMREHIGLITKTATADGIALPPRPPRPARSVAVSSPAH